LRRRQRSPDGVCPTKTDAANRNPPRVGLLDDEFPAVVRIITGVPRRDEEYPALPPQSPEIAPEFPDQLPKPVKEGDDT
jgi:hypothetical protein